MRVTIITCVCNHHNYEDYQNCKTKVRIDFPEDNTTRQLKMRVVDEFFPRVKSIGDFDLFYWLTVEEEDRLSEFLDDDGVKIGSMKNLRWKDDQMMTFYLKLVYDKTQDVTVYLKCDNNPTRSLAVSPRMKNSELHKLLQEEYNLPSLVIEAKCEFFERPADKTIENNSEVELSRSKIFQPTVVLFVHEQDIAAGSSKQPSEKKPEAGEEKILKSKPCCIVL
ncbi:uncharacterized protein LOC134846312 [Symsagittifera roscoffensis]|uniref:uncharacterized protein LOC134846312 n=1 Tax=Symsagittifera roscoffensis TaxID=84072 RepID=UPI00307BE8E0